MKFMDTSATVFNLFSGTRKGMDAFAFHSFGRLPVAQRNHHTSSDQSESIQGLYTVVFSELYGSGRHWSDFFAAHLSSMGKMFGGYIRRLFCVGFFSFFSGATYRDWTMILCTLVPLEGYLVGSEMHRLCVCSSLKMLTQLFIDVH